MKAICALFLALIVSTGSFAADFDQTALETLLSAPAVILRGDVQSDETVASIYGSAIGVAKIKNTCERDAVSARCSLWINYELGETVLEYSTTADGKDLFSQYVEVVRGL